MKVFKYSNKIRTGKLIVKGLIVLFLFLFPLILLENKPADFSSGIDYYLAMSTPLIMILGFVLYLGSWSDLEISEDGLDIEFLGSKLHVPWAGIVEIKHVGSKMFGVTIVLTKKEYLTPLHRIYSLFTVGSFLPGLHIHPHFLQFNELSKLIQKYRYNV